MDADPLIVDANTGIEETGGRLFRLKPKAPRAGFIVTENGARVGVVTGIDLPTALSHTPAATNERPRRAQAESPRSEKTAALGGLVAGVAHQVDTPIGPATTAFAERAKDFAASTGGGTLGRSDLERFFDPFFTTKRDRGDTGLGLRIVDNLTTARLGRAPMSQAAFDAHRSAR